MIRLIETSRGGEPGHFRQIQCRRGDRVVCFYRHPVQGDFRCGIYGRYGVRTWICRVGEMLLFEALIRLNGDPLHD